MPSLIKHVLYTGRTRTTGGRNGSTRSSDGRLDVRLAPPGSSYPGTNPEQMFAAGWSACFIEAMRRAAANLKIPLPTDLAVDAEIDLGTTDDAYLLQARLNVCLPGIAPDVAQQVIEAAHATCPYSKAIRGNIDVAISLQAH